MEDRKTILIVEDDKYIIHFLSISLKEEDYGLWVAKTVKEAVSLFYANRPDLVILDLGLPDADGLEFIRYARKSGAVPILVLSARTSEKDKVSALDLGANDYITKPFGTAELMARVRAALRNSRHSSEMGAVPGGIFQVRDLVIDYDRRQVTVAGKEINLTQTEYNIVTLLSEQAGKVLTYSQIICAVWGGTDSGSVKKLQVNMANIRKKLGVDYIETIRGAGYKIEKEN